MSEHFERTTVIVLTSNYRIRGKISLIPKNRVTDFILREGPFVVLTDVEVMDRDGKQLFTSKFINLKRDQIEVIASEDAVTYPS